MNVVRAVGIALLTACGLAFGADYAAVPGGRFVSVLPQGPVPTATVPVDIAPFAVRTTPVTAGEYLAFVRAHPEWQRTQVPEVFADKRYLIDWRSATQFADDGAALRPQTNVSWFAAKAFCESEDARLP